MRVKLSYTAQASDILNECAYLLANKGDTLKEIIGLFNALQADLRADDVSTQRVFESIDSLRKGLSEVDIRLMEIEEMVGGHDAYHRAQRKGAGEDVLSALPPEPAEDAETEVPND